MCLGGWVDEVVWVNKCSRAFGYWRLECRADV
jgi:hypothetical protein